MAVVVVIGIIAVIAVPIYNNTSTKVKQKEYENVVTAIEVASERYAEKTSKIRFSVQELVDSGEYETDNEQGEVLSPIDRSVMNCYILEVTHENENYDAKMTETNSCEEAEDLKNRPAVKIQAKTVDGKEVEENTWVNQDVILTASLGESTGIKINSYEWFANYYKVSDTTSNSYTVTASTILNTPYQVRINITKDGKYYTVTGTIVVKIDKQKPIITEVKIKNKDIWTIENKEVGADMTDYNGSGIKGYYISKNPSGSSSMMQEDEITSLGNGAYYAWAIDNAGNISDKKEFKISTVDSAPTKPVITASDGLKSSTWHPNNFILHFESTTNGSPITYYYGESPAKMTETGNDLSMTPRIVNKPFYVKACSQTMLCSSYSYYMVNYDKTKPSISISETVTGTVINGWTKDPIKLDITITDNESGIDSYAVTTTNTNPGSWSGWVEAANKRSVTKLINKNGDYYVWVKDKAGNMSYRYWPIYNIDNEGPKVVDWTISGSWSRGYTFSIDYYDEGVGADYEGYFKITTSSTQPSSGYKTYDGKFSMECGETYYWWHRLDDLLGNQTYYKAPTTKYHSCPKDDYDDYGSNWVDPCQLTRTDGICSYTSDICTMYANSITWWRIHNNSNYSDSEKEKKKNSCQSKNQTIGNKHGWNLTDNQTNWVSGSTNIYTYCGLRSASYWASRDDTDLNMATCAQ